MTDHAPVNSTGQEAIDFDEFFARWRADRLAKLVAGQPPEFWKAVGEKLDNSPDETITMDELMALLHDEDLN
ncbi:hypothetical protein SAMN05661103_3513 [Agrobacterium sp. 719_389]|nr:hypothetical protein SAMN05661103_3513 [Agrobacterium sp. 719_389]